MVRWHHPSLRAVIDTQKPPPLPPAATALSCDLTNPRSMQQHINSMSGNRETLVRGTPGNAFFLLMCGFHDNTVIPNRPSNDTLLKLDISKANGRILVVDETSNSVETIE